MFSTGTLVLDIFTTCDYESKGGRKGGRWVSFLIELKGARSQLVIIFTVGEVVFFIFTLITAFTLVMV
jgi:hypothetical protein